MAQVRIQEAASWRLDEIYRHTREHWGEAQAERYIKGLFDSFDLIETHGIASHPVPAIFNVRGFFGSIAIPVERLMPEREPAAKGDGVDA